MLPISIFIHDLLNTLYVQSTLVLAQDATANSILLQQNILQT